MEQYSKEQLVDALRSADSAGDQEAVDEIVGALNSMDEKAFNSENASPTKKEYEEDVLTRDDDGDRIFGELLLDKRYRDSLKIFGKATDRGTEDLEELREKAFEYTNSTINNEVSLADTAIAAANMSDEEKEALSYIFEVSGETAITGPKSRGLGEQLSDVPEAIFTPSNLVGGWVTKPIKNAATKKAIQELFKVGAKSDTMKAGIKQSAKRAGAAGGAILGANDLALQTQVEMELNPDQEYSPGRTATSAALGYVGGRALPAAAKAIGGAVKGTGAAASQVAKRIISPIKSTKETLGFAQDATVRAIGGSSASKMGVAQEAEKVLGSGSVSDGATKIFDTMGSTLKTVDDGFKAKFIELGNLEGARPEDLFTFVDRLTKSKYLKGSNFSDIKTVRDQVRDGVMSVSQGMREIKGSMSDIAYQARLDKAGNKRILKGFADDASDMFKKAASKSKLGKEIKALDKEYSTFKKTMDSKAIEPFTRKGQTPGEIVTHLRNRISADNPLKSKEYLDQIESLAKLSDNPNLVNDQKTALSQILAEKLFKGNSATALKSYLSEPGGKEVLKRLFPALAEDGLFSRLETITKNASTSSNLGVYIMRILGGAGAAMLGAQSGALSGAASGVGGLVLADKLLTSKWFMGKAMEVFSKAPRQAKRPAAKMAKGLLKLGMSEKEVSGIMDTMLGAGIWGYFMGDEDYRKGILAAGSIAGEFIPDKSTVSKGVDSLIP